MSSMETIGVEDNDSIPENTSTGVEEMECSFPSKVALSCGVTVVVGVIAGEAVEVAITPSDVGFVANSSSEINWR